METRAAADMRIVLLGKTGSGKSSLANTILREADLFQVVHSSASGTMVCKSETRSVDGRRVQLIDTPGFFDTDPNSPDVKKEILNCLIECASGVDTFLLVLKVERFTKHEQSVAEVFCQHFSDEALKYTTVVFTQGDQMSEGKTIKEWIKDNEALHTLVEKCGGRCFVFDNRYWNNSQDPHRNNQNQLKELLKTVDQTMKQNGGSYTNANLRMVQGEINEQIKSIKSNPENAHMSEKEVEEKAKENTFKVLWSVVATVVLGVGALVGILTLKR